jgi:formylglycine-generating enzyme required for sulfatase activity
MKIPANFLRRTGYRLPTETEWEYVCQANASTSFSFGEPVELLERYGWYVDNSHSRSWPVGSLRPNPLGVFDMHGNAHEWCQDAYEQKGRRASGEIETVKRETERLLLGGSFSDRPEDLCASHGTHDQPVAPRFNQGFRPARTYR